MQIKKVHIELFLYVILSNVYFNLIGTISFGELWVLIVTPFILNTNILKKHPILKKVTFFYVLYFTAQLISEIIIGNEINNVLKGLANTVVSCFTMIYLFDRLKKDYYLIAFFFLFLAIRNLFFINTIGLGEEGVEFGINSSSFFKYKITPILTNLMLFISFFLLRRKHWGFTIILLIGLVLLYINYSARSSALLLVFAILIILFGKWLVRHRKSLFLPLLFLFTISYGFYFAWVNFQLHGDLAVRNNQIDNLKNPYNPFELLFYGRTEVFVGIKAIQDSPLWGHGSWAKDKDSKYSILLQELKNKEVNYNILDRADKIPSHSVIIGAGVYNGILALLIVSYLFLFILKIQLSVFNILVNSPLVLIYSFNLVSLIWIGLFSPLTNLRLGMPLIFSLSLIFFNDYINYKGIKNANTIKLLNK